jgi:SAM-dependent methyltransferase
VTSPQARSFGAAADRYDRYRPGYAAAAVEWALGPRPLRVVDLGAGTGILSRLLHRLGHDVIAVEPDRLMRAQLAASFRGAPAEPVFGGAEHPQRLPGITVAAGTAEEIPLRDGSVDAVVAGQAYHWFDGTRAHAEIARVLRPGGAFAAMWNDADLGTEWTVRFAELIDGPQPVRPALDFGDRFGPVAPGEFPHDMWMTPDHLVALATTRSPYLVGSPRERQDLVDAIRVLLAGPELAGRERFPMPHITRVYRAYLAASPGA